MSATIAKHARQIERMQAKLDMIEKWAQEFVEVQIPALKARLEAFEQVAGIEVDVIGERLAVLEGRNPAVPLSNAERYGPRMAPPFRGDPPTYGVKYMGPVGRFKIIDPDGNEIGEEIKGKAEAERQARDLAARAIIATQAGA